MRKVPISLILDDPAPGVFVYHEHHPTGFLADGRPIPNRVPNSFMSDFCDVAEEIGLAGKFSVVPMPGGKGSVDTHLEGHTDEEVAEWLDMVKIRLMPSFSICPEMLTHAGYIDLATGEMIPEQENTWSFRQSAETLTAYITKALEILKNVGINSVGVTSPWDFGVENEDAYALAVGRAVEQVWGEKESWYFCRSLVGQENARPWLAAEEDGRKIVSVPATFHDNFWQSMDTTDCSEEYISSIADRYLTADGSQGEILRVLETGGWPILLTHWQSQFSNGSGTGLKALRLVGQRINRFLSDRVEWTSYENLMRLTLQEERG